MRSNIVVSLLAHATVAEKLTVGRGIACQTAQRCIVGASDATIVASQAACSSILVVKEIAQTAAVIKVAVERIVARKAGSGTNTCTRQATLIT